MKRFCNRNKIVFINTSPLICVKLCERKVRRAENLPGGGIQCKEVLKVKTKTPAFAVLILAALIFGAGNVKGENSGNVRSEEVPSAKGDLEIEGFLPQLSGFGDIDFQNAANVKIAEFHDEIIASAESSKYAKKVSFSYRDDFLSRERNAQSILIQATVTSSTTRTYLRAFTFDYMNEKEFSITSEEFLGKNGVAIAGDIIESAIISEPDKYNAAFRKISNEEDFYIDNNDCVVIYNNYKFAIDLSALKNLTLDGESVKQNSTSRDVKYIPIRRVCEEFGYDVFWNQGSKSVEIRKGRKVILISIGEIVAQIDNARFDLDAPPILENGETYVPLNFFEQALSLYYHLDPDDSLTLSLYDSGSDDGYAS